MRYGKPDQNQKEIIRAFKSIGCDVAIVTLVPGLFDLLVTRAGQIWMVEVKKLGVRQIKTTQQERFKYLTDDEKRFHERCQAPVWIVASQEEAIELVNNGTL